jgi:HSP20 family protein
VNRAKKEGKTLAFKKMIPFRKGEKKELTPRGEFWGDNPFALLQNNMNRLMEGFSKEWGAGFLTDSNVAIDVKETDEAIEVVAEIPGIDEKDLDISLDQNSVTIRGEKKAEKEEKKGDYYHMERSYGTFCRTIPLPVEINSEKAQANYQKGVLRVMLPKTQAQKESTRKIQIRTS